MPRQKTQPSNLERALDDSCLVLRADLVGRTGDKCSCPTSPKGGGQWVVQAPKDTRIWSFDPNTQLQKDLWLSTRDGDAGKEERIALLRWYCFTCNTVQMP